MNVRSIEFRLVSWSTAICVLLFVGFGAYTYLRLDYYMDRALDEYLRHRALQIGATLLMQIGDTGKGYVAEQIDARYAPDRNDRFVRIRKEGEAPFYVSSKPLDGSFNPDSVPLYSKKADFNRYIELGGQNIALLSIPYIVGDDTYIIDVGSSTLQNKQVLRAFLFTLCLGLPVMLFISTSGSLVLIKKVLFPVREISDVAGVISSSNLSQRLPVAKSGDEIEQLSIVLNQMIDRLDEAFQHAKRFTADASHELRTPLTIVRGELEALTQEQGLSRPTREKLSSILEETERLVKIVQGLFAISRLEAGEAFMERKRLDLSRLVTSTVEQMVLLAEEKDVRLNCLARELVEIEGDPARLKQIIVNLLDNAIKYSPEGSAITLLTKIEQGRAVFEVIDQGPGIPEKDLPHVFERFFRADDMRSRNKDGAGLGLAIVRSICVAHGGDVEINNQSGAGCLVRVTLPQISKPRAESQTAY
jgi:heavy metal sensor kinase